MRCSSRPCIKCTKYAGRLQPYPTPLFARCQFPPFPFPVCLQANGFIPLQSGTAHIYSEHLSGRSQGPRIRLALRCTSRHCTALHVSMLSASRNTHTHTRVATPSTTTFVCRHRHSNVPGRDALWNERGVRPRAAIEAVVVVINLIPKPSSRIAELICIAVCSNSHPATTDKQVQTETSKLGLPMQKIEFRRSKLTTARESGGGVLSSELAADLQDAPLAVSSGCLHCGGGGWVAT